nr:MAG TPA: hypothetical protein [Caudoviricetes sp.]
MYEDQTDLQYSLHGETLTSSVSPSFQKIGNLKGRLH